MVTLPISIARAPPIYVTLLLTNITDALPFINNQVLRKIKIAVESDVKNWAYISLR